MTSLLILGTGLFDAQSALCSPCIPWCPDAEQLKPSYRSNLTFASMRHTSAAAAFQITELTCFSLSGASSRGTVRHMTDSCCLFTVSPPSWWQIIFLQGLGCVEAVLACLLSLTHVHISRSSSRLVNIICKNILNILKELIMIKLKNWIKDLFTFLSVC